MLVDIPHNILFICPIFPDFLALTGVSSTAGGTGSQVQFLVGKLISHMPGDMAKKQNKTERAKMIRKSSYN